MNPNRRTTLALMAGALASPAAAAKADDPIAGMMVINALGGLGNPNDEIERDGPFLDARSFADAHASGLTAVNITLGYVMGKGEPFEETVQAIGQWDRLVRDNPRDLIKVLGVADIQRAKHEGKIGLIYGFQNGAMMGDDAKRVDIFANLGVRVFQLTYNDGNRLGDGSMPATNRGLTPFGREVVARLNADKVMVDLSHSGQQICLDATRASKQPISINHTGCRALTDLPRNKTDEELRLVAEKGGFVGIYFMPFLAADGQAHATDAVAHIEHALKVCGEDHVGIGTDGGTTQIDDLGGYAAALAKENADRRAAGISAPGESATTYPFVIDLRGPDQFRKLARMLAARGHSRARIEKIMGLNFLRYAKEIWGA